MDWGLFQINDRYWCKNSEKRRTNFESKYDGIFFQLKKAIAMTKMFVAWIANVSDEQTNMFFYLKKHIYL